MEVTLIGYTSAIFHDPALQISAPTEPDHCFNMYHTEANTEFFFRGRLSVTSNLESKETNVNLSLVA